MDRQEFVDKLNRHIERTATMRDERRYPVTPGPSILDLINNERLLAAGDYRRGLDHGLYTIDQANIEHRKPFYALKSAWAKACAEKESAEFRRGLETVQFIFNSPYKWLEGKRP